MIERFEDQISYERKQKTKHYLAEKEISQLFEVTIMTYI